MLNPCEDILSVELSVKKKLVSAACQREIPKCSFLLDFPVPER